MGTLDEMTKRQMPSKENVYKKEIRIGLLTSKFTVEFFKFLFFPDFNFNHLIVTQQILPDGDSLLL